MLKKIFLILSILFYHHLFSEEIMWWLVDDTATVDNNSIRSFLLSYEEDDNHWAAVRVKASVDDVIMYLDVESPDFPGERFSWEDGAGYLGETGDGRWGTGNWANQSPLDGLDREIWESARFQVELGWITYDDVLDSVNWMALAETDPVVKSEIQQHLYERGTIAPPGYTQWTPTDFHTYSVPEPSVSTFIFLGISLLLLKRKL